MTVLVADPDMRHDAGPEAQRVDPIRGPRRDLDLARLDARREIHHLVVRARHLAAAPGELEAVDRGVTNPAR
jgi:hypothetical protein